MCLIRSAANVCSGVVFELEGPPHFNAEILDRVGCVANGNTITFTSVSVKCNMASRCTHTPLSFSGVLENDRLRGTYTHGEDKTKVSWKRTRKTFNTRALVGAACKRKRPERSPAPQDAVENPF